MLFFRTDNLNTNTRKYAFSSFSCSRHRLQPIEWERFGETVCEPRTGKRIFLKAIIETPKLFGAICCYCLHLEPFTGIVGRIGQCSDVLADARKQHNAFPDQPIIIGGDLNTVGHSLARLSPNYCNDKFRFLSIGKSEPRFWKENVFDVNAENDEKERQNEKLAAFACFDEKTLCDAVNFGLADPFDVDADYTFSNYFGLYKAKLDWLLLKNLHVVSKYMANEDFSASDHKAIGVIVSK